MQELDRQELLADAAEAVKLAAHLAKRLRECADNASARDVEIAAMLLTRVKGRLSGEGPG